MKGTVLKISVSFFVVLLGGLSLSIPSKANKFSLYGKVQNVGPFGICAATEVINSFIYLDNFAPSVFGPTPLIPPGISNDQALAWFALAGWQTGLNPQREGYYTHFWNSSNTGNPDSGLLQWKKWWVNDFAPGVKMRFESMIESVNGPPTEEFLLTQMKNHQDVELIIEKVNDPTWVHCVGLISMQDGNINYQDPNNPTKLETVPLITFPSGSPHAGKLGFLLPGDGNVYIRSALAESVAVPEPATLALLGLGSLGLLGCKRRKAHMN